MKKVFYLSLFICFFLMPVHMKAEPETRYRHALIFAYSPANSIYEDENIKLEIYNQQLWAFNKTTKTIFIDLAQSFAYHNGISMPLLNDNDKKHDSKRENDKSSYLSIAPMLGSAQKETWICNISWGIYGKYTTSESPNNDFTDYDKRLLTLINDLLAESRAADPKGKVHVGTATRHLTEDESINNIGVSVAYAFSKNAEEWKNVTISTWVSDVIFAPYYVEMPVDLTKQKKKGFALKETGPAKIHIKADSPFEFDNDKSPLIVCDWTGHYNKGEFTLSYTMIKKTKKNIFKLIGGSLLAGFSGAPGIALLSKAFDEIFYKQTILFDGCNADWGKLTYATGDASRTKRTL